MTARPSVDDLKKVPHHLYSIIDYREESSETTTFNVQKYREKAIKVINEIWTRGNIPIVCGGTNYYIEALLFEKQDTSQISSNPIGFDRDFFEE